MDSGAATALIQKGRSLLPIGITSVVGTFQVGDAVEIIDPDGLVFARGLVTCDAETARSIAAETFGGPSDGPVQQ